MKTQLQIVTTGLDILSKLPENQQDELILIAQFLLRQKEIEALEDSHKLEQRRAALEHYSTLIEQIKNLKISQ